MVEKMVTPVMNDKMHPSRKFRFPRARRSTTGRAKVRLRITKRMPAAPAMTPAWPLKIVKRRCENCGNHRGAKKALKRPEHNHAFDVPCKSAEQAREGESGRRGSEQPPCRKYTCQPARKGNHGDFGDQIGGLHPTDLVLGGGQSAADVLQGRGNNLDVQQGHEHSHAHDHKGKNLPEPACGSGGVAHRPALSDAAAFSSEPVFTLAVTESPGRNWPRVAVSLSSTMRTA